MGPSDCCFLQFYIKEPPRAPPECRLLVLTIDLTCALQAARAAAATRQAALGHFLWTLEFGCLFPSDKITKKKKKKVLFIN